MIILIAILLLLVLPALTALIIFTVGGALVLVLRICAALMSTMAR